MLCVVYNLWSILRFTKEYKLGLIPDWVNTSSNSLVKSLIGRYNIELIPRNANKSKRRTIFELKKANPATKETLEEALIVAEKQIEEKKYEVELIDAGVKKDNIIKIAIAFKGKDTLIKWR